MLDCISKYAQVGVATKKQNRGFRNMVMQVLDAIDGFLYYPVLLIVMAAAGL